MSIIPDYIEQQKGPIYTVSQLNEETRLLLESHFTLIWVQGEISNLSKPASGHLYFSLKDKNARVRCALFKNQHSWLDFNPQDGMHVLASAKVSLYQSRGDFQLIIERIEEVGDGLLQQAFSVLKQKLEQLGLFDKAHKKKIPLFPRSIGVITSPTGAAVKDILVTLRRRFPLIPVIIYPCEVQGKQAAAKVASAIKLADNRCECDVIILARGGGSLEDLWAFNEEVLAHAIYACRLPIVTGIGHEIDFTIADFVADWRAATPTAAAECVSPDQREYYSQLSQLKQNVTEKIFKLIHHKYRDLEFYRHHLPHPSRYIQAQMQRIDQYGQIIINSFKYFLQLKFNQVGRITQSLKRYDPHQQLKQWRQQVQWYQDRLEKTIQTQIKAKREVLSYMRAKLDALSPLATLARGYAIVSNAQKEIIHNAHQLSIEELITIQFYQGRAISEVKKLK